MLELFYSISCAKNECNEPMIIQANEFTPFEKIVGEIYTAYEIRLRKNHSFDFDDLIMMTIIFFTCT